jgi:hypothetical protein
MGPLYPSFPLLVCGAVFALLGKHALDMKGKQNHREMWGAFTLSVTPASLFCLWVGCFEISGMGRNAILIPAGAIFGAAAFAYLGYLAQDRRATTPPVTDRPATPTPASPAMPAQPAEPLTLQEQATRIAIWQSVFEQMDDYARAMNLGYAMLDTWSEKAKADRRGLVASIGAFWTPIVDLTCCRLSTAFQGLSWICRTRRRRITGCSSCRWPAH